MIKSVEYQYKLSRDVAALMLRNQFDQIARLTTSKWLPPSILAVAYNKAGVIIGIIKKDEEHVEAQGKE